MHFLPLRAEEMQDDLFAYPLEYKEEEVLGNVRQDDSMMERVPRSEEFFIVNRDFVKSSV